MSRPEIRAALDTSVLMRLLTGQPSAQAEAARRFMAETETEGAKAFVSNLAVLEAYFACQHHYGMPKAAVIAGLHALLSLPTFVVHPQLLALLATKGLASAKPGFLARLIHAECAAAGIQLATFEKSASSLPDALLLKRA